MLSTKQIDRHRDQIKLPRILGSAKKSMSHIILTYPWEITLGAWWGACEIKGIEQAYKSSTSRLGNICSDTILF